MDRETFFHHFGQRRQKVRTHRGIATGSVVLGGQLLRNKGFEGGRLMLIRGQRPGQYRISHRLDEEKRNRFGFPSSGLYVDAHRSFQDFRGASVDALRLSTLLLLLALGMAGVGART